MTPMTPPRKCTPRLAAGLTALAVVLSAAGADAAMVTRTNTLDGFADNSSFNRAITFTAADFAGGSSILTDLDVSVFFAKSNNNSFVPEGSAINSGTPFLNEIHLMLTAPDGTTSVTLISNDTTGTDQSFNTGDAGFKGTITFDQSAATVVNADPDLLTPGTFRPASPPGQSLNMFTGLNAIGTWNLFIGDDVGADGLSFYEYSLTARTESVVDGGAVPEPASMTLAGLLGCGLAGAGWRKRKVVA